MKIIITDIAGADHNLKDVILGLASDLHIINSRLMMVEKELGLNQSTVEAELIEEEDANPKSPE